MNALNLTLILTFCIIAPLSQATPKATQPLAIQSSKLNQTQQQINAQECSYTAIVKTSCSSTIFNVRGNIDLVLADAFDNQVYVPQLDGPFEACTENIYDIYGPCISQVCHIQIYMNGEPGWLLESVIVDNYIHDPVTFYYNTYIHGGGPYGLNFCADY